MRDPMEVFGGESATPVQHAASATPTQEPKSHAKAEDAPCSTRRPLPPVPAFDPRLLPDSLRPWITDAAERMQCPKEFLAIPAMVGLAGALGRRVAIRPKQKDDWQVIPNLWGLIVGRPSSMKSPAISEAMRPLRRLEVAASEAFKSIQAEHAAGCVVAETRAAVLKKALATAIKRGDNDTAQRLARELGECEAAEPVRQRFLVVDATVEKLQDILSQNANGVTLLRDELVGLWRQLDKVGWEGARQFLLEAWTGTGHYVVDRVRRGTIDISNPTLCIVGGVQPGPLERYLLGELESGVRDDGFAQRFQLAVWPDSDPKWKNVDRWPDSKARNLAFSTYERLAAITGDDVAAERDKFDGDAAPFLRFCDEVQVRFDGWRAVLEGRLRSGDEAAVMEAHLCKYRSLVPSLALLDHLACGRSGPVALSSVRRAIAWADYLEQHARRIYHPLLRRHDPKGAARAELAGFIRSLGGVATVRELMRGGPCFKDRKIATAAIDDLATHSFGRWELPAPGPGGGHPARRFRLVATDTTPALDSATGGCVSVSGGMVSEKGENASVGDTGDRDDSGGFSIGADGSLEAVK